MFVLFGLTENGVVAPAKTCMQAYILVMLLLLLLLLFY
jgi:hypothetical protein